LCSLAGTPLPKGTHVDLTAGFSVSNQSHGVMLSNYFGGFYSAPASLGSNDSQPLANLTSAGLTAAPV